MPKLKLLGENETPGEVPVPPRDTVCGLAAPLSVTESVPLEVPVIVGEKVTLIVHELPAARLEPQLFVWEKPALAAIAEIVNDAVPVLVSVTG